MGDHPGDCHLAAAVLALLLSPWHALHESFPDVRQLRDLIDGEAGRTALRTVLEARGLLEG